MSSENPRCENHAAPVLCNAGCGFYSNVGTEGLCSKCYREKQTREQGQLKAMDEVLKAQSPVVEQKQPAAVAEHKQESAAAAAAPAPAPAAPAPESSTAGTALSPGTTLHPEAPKPSTTRCLTCNKKVGLTGFHCKCNPDAVFCSQHRYAEAHCCTFDYKKQQQQQLAANNPLVQAQKLQRF